MEKCHCENQRIKMRSEEEKNRLISRLHRIEGQMRGVQKMIEDDRYCDEILIQLSAIDKAIKSLANLMLDAHMHTCLVEHIKNNELEIIDEIVELFKRFQ